MCCPHIRSLLIVEIALLPVHLVCFSSLTPGLKLERGLQAYPLDLVRTRLAAQTTTHYYKGIWHALSTIVKDEGLFGLYRGLGATLTQVAPSLAMNYCAYETIRSYWMSHEPARQSPTVSYIPRFVLHSRTTPLHPLPSLPPGVARCGSAALPICTLADQSLHKCSHVTHLFLMDRFGVCMLSAFIFRRDPSLQSKTKTSSALQEVHDLVHTNVSTLAHWLRLYAHKPHSAVQVTMSLASGSIAGLVSSTATFPLDLIRRRMQLQGQGGCQVQYTSYRHAFQTVIQREGFVGLYHGILPEYYKVVPGVAIAFCTYELMKSMLGVQTNVVNR